MPSFYTICTKVEIIHICVTSVDCIEESRQSTRSASIAPDADPHPVVHAERLLPDAPEAGLAGRLLGDGVLPQDRPVGQLDLQAVREEPAPVLQVEVRVDRSPVPAGAGHVGLVDLVAFVTSVQRSRFFHIFKATNHKSPNGQIV